MNKTIIKLFTAFAALLLVLGMADAVSAQRRGRGRVYTQGQVDRLIKNVETRTDTFVGQFDKSLDRSRLNGTQREDNLNERAKEFERATDELRSNFNSRNRYLDNRDDVARCLNLASDINVAMRNRRLGRATENNWANVRRELNTLAAVYNLPRIGALGYR